MLYMCIFFQLIIERVFGKFPTHGSVVFRINTLVYTTLSQLFDSEDLVMAQICNNFNT